MVDEVVVELQNSDSEGETDENNESEENFDGYLDETEMKECWRRRQSKAIVMKTGMQVMKIRETVRKKWKLKYHQYSPMF